MEPTKDFDFTWALRYYWSGQKVRRAAWGEGEFCQMVPGQPTDKMPYFTSEDTFTTPTLIPVESVLASDWELVE
jgi:hypothetical protein